MSSHEQVQPPEPSHPRCSPHAEPTIPEGPPRPDASDERLFDHYARTGCERSFRVIVQRYEARIQGFLRRRVPDSTRIEDLTQEIFRRMIGGAKNFDPGISTFSKWSHTITENVLRNHFRSVARDRLHCFTDVAMRGEVRRGCADPVAAVEARQPSPDAVAYNSELRRALVAAIRELAPTYRAPFVMYHLEQMDFGEVAEKLEIPVGTAKSRTHRARLKLRAALEAFGADEPVADPPPAPEEPGPADAAEE